MQNFVWPATVSTADVDRQSPFRQLPNYCLAVRLARAATYIWAWLCQFLNCFASSIAATHTKYNPTHVIQCVGVVRALMPDD